MDPSRATAGGMDLPPLSLTAVAAVVLALALVLVGIWLGRWWGSVVRRDRGRVAARGEVDAEALLARHGYTVEARQVAARWAIEVDGQSVDVGVRADLIVTRKGRRYVAEVKTGAYAPDPCLPATRRQLLEYSCVFGVQVLLVDVAAGTIHAVRFPATGQR